MSDCPTCRSRPGPPSPRLASTDPGHHCKSVLDVIQRVRDAQHFNARVYDRILRSAARQGMPMYTKGQLVRGYHVLVKAGRLEADLRLVQVSGRKEREPVVQMNGSMGRMQRRGTPVPLEGGGRIGLGQAESRQVGPSIVAGAHVGFDARRYRVINAADGFALHTRCTHPVEHMLGNQGAARRRRPVGTECGGFAGHAP